MITPWDVLTSSNQYPERSESPECVTGVRINAADLAERVSKLLGALNLTAKVSSGFRTAKVNASVPNSAKASAHMTGEAVDLSDPTGSIARALLARTDLLELHDLYLENPQHTPYWVHLQSRRTKSGNRVFQP